MSNSNQPTRYATVHLTVEREVPSAAALPEQLKLLGLSDQTQEALWVIAYDSIQGIRTVVEVARGNYHEMDVSIPAVLSVPLLAACDRFEIAHNHPSGDVSPTVLDVDLTKKVLAAANTCGLYFEDHIILAPSGDYYSFFENGLLGPGRTVTRGHQRAS
jgi:DNA repair protein RadC